MHSRQNDRCSSDDRIAVKRGSCADCGGVLLPAGYGFADRAGSVFEVVCRSCGNRSAIRSGLLRVSPLESTVRGFLCSRPSASRSRDSGTPRHHFDSFIPEVG